MILTEADGMREAYVVNLHVQTVNRASSGDLITPLTPDRLEEVG